MQARRNAGSANAGIAGILPAGSGDAGIFSGSLARTVTGVHAGCLRSQQHVAFRHPLVLTVITIGSLLLGGSIALRAMRHSGLFASSAESINADNIDQRLQRAATLALGDRRGAVIVMDPQTGRIRAVVNPELA